MSKLLYEFGNILHRISEKENRKAHKLFNTLDKATSDEFNDMKNKLFTHLIQYAFKNVPYYNRIMLKYNIIPGEVRSLQDIKKFPLLTKTDIRENYSDFLSKEISGLKNHYRRSGGTTGEPVKVYIDRMAETMETLSYLRGLQWMGWHPGLKMLRLFGGSLGQGFDNSLRAQLKSKILNQVFLPAFDLKDNNVSTYVETINKNGDSVIISYASAVYNLALLMKKYSLTCSRVQLIITTAELLPAEWKNEIKDVFQCPVKSYYGCGELNSLGYQETEGDTYTIPNDVNYVESIEHNNIKNTLAITSLHNKAMPMIRYIPGDIGIVSHEPVKDQKYYGITNLMGRTADLFMDRFGNKVSNILGTHSIFKLEIPVKKYQFIQWSLNTLEFRYNLIKDDEDITRNDKERILEIYRGILGPNLTINFNHTDNFELSKMGKFRIVINKINE